MAVAGRKRSQGKLPVAGFENFPPMAMQEKSRSTNPAMSTRTSKKQPFKQTSASGSRPIGKLGDLGGRGQLNKGRRKL